jgi:hypothetical protein
MRKSVVSSEEILFSSEEKIFSSEEIPPGLPFNLLGIRGKRDGGL